MQVDSYEPCLCGSVRKWKFCCPRELHADVQRLAEQIEENNYVVAQELLRKLLNRYPQQRCLRAFRVLLYLLTDNYDECSTAVRELEEVDSDHPMIHLGRCMLHALEGNLDAAIESYYLRQQKCFQIKRENACAELHLWMDPRWLVYELARACKRQAPVILGMIDHNQAVAKWLRAETFDQLVLQIEPLVAFRDRHRENLRQRALDRDQTTLALALDCFAMLDARQILDRLLEENPDDPWWVYGSGIVLTALGREKEGAKALRRFARMPHADPGWAVSSLILAEYLDPLPVGYLVRNLQVEVSDPDGLMTFLLSDRRFFKDELVEWNNDEPPPKLVSLVLDRPRATSDEEQSDPASWPSIRGVLLLFGKQIDRPAMLRGQVFGQEIEDFVKSTVAPWVVSPWQTTGETRCNGFLDAWLRPRISPKSMSSWDMAEATGQRLRFEIEETWMNLPHPLLNGQTPREVGSTDPVAMTAALQQLEFQPFVIRAGIDLSDLWDRFGLCRIIVPSPSEPNTSRNWEQVSIFELVRYDYSNLSFWDQVSIAHLLSNVGLETCILRLWLLLADVIIADPPSIELSDAAKAAVRNLWIIGTYRATQLSIDAAERVPLLEKLYQLTRDMASIRAVVWASLILALRHKNPERAVAIYEEGRSQILQQTLLPVEQQLIEIVDNVMNEWRPIRFPIGAASTALLASVGQTNDLPSTERKLWLPGDP